MELLYQATKVTDESIEQARQVMARQMQLEGEAFIDEAARRTMALPGYAHLDITEVRPNTARSMRAVLEALEHGDMSLFGGVLAEVAYMRAMQGLSPRSFYELADVTEALLNDLAGRCLSGVQELMSAAIVARNIADGSRAVILDAFQRAHFETRAEVEHLVSQFSAPILPALPGVLVLPIVGAVSAARAEQIVDALLAGIARHGAHTVILDITGITEVDGSLAAHLRRATATVRLVGAQVVLVGINPAAARVLAAANELSGVTILPNLATALLAAPRSR